MKSRRRLRAVLRRSSRLPIGSADPSQLARSVKRVYRRARRAFEAACEEASAANLHEWRKHVKYLWHQMQFLESPGCPAIKRLGGEFHRLSDDLGDDHDLAVLRGWVQKKPALLSPGASRRFSAAVSRRQSHLQKAAFTRGLRIHSDRPGKFAEWLTTAITATRGA
jgi:CHAD domain-containing protein